MEDDEVPQGPPQPPTRPKMKVSWQTMNEHHVPLHLRDYCAHEVIPLNALVVFLSYYYYSHFLF